MIPLHATLGADGEVIPCPDVFEWTRWFQRSFNERRVKADEVEGFLVSTVFLGLDHGFWPGKHLWFETMVFRIREDGRLGCECATERYATIEEARAGHAAICDKVRSGEIGE